MTRRWWRDVWHSPMATEYLDADVHGLRRLAVLVDTFWREPSKELAEAITKQQAHYGLTPLDRRRLEWHISQVTDASARREQRTQRKSARTAVDPRSLLEGEPTSTRQPPALAA